MLSEGDKKQAQETEAIKNQIKAASFKLGILEQSLVALKVAPEDEDKMRLAVKQLQGVIQSLNSLRA